MGTYIEEKGTQNQSYHKGCINQSSFPSEHSQMNIDDMELKEEWQDEDFPRPLPEVNAEEEIDSNENNESESPPNTLELCGNRHIKKHQPPPTLNLENNEGSLVVGEVPDQTQDDDAIFNIDDLQTPTGSVFLGNSHAFEWEDDLPRAKGRGSSASEYVFTENLVTDIKDQDGRKWRIFLSGERKVDMTAIEPYKQVISHGGYYGDGLNAIIVFASCYLPENNIPEYRYVMDNLFRYIIGTLDLMFVEDYTLVYLNGVTPRNKIPSIGWIKKCYQATDRRLKKNLKSLLVVHPAWYVKALMAIIRPFISSKFGRKVRFVKSLSELSQIIALDHIHIPDCIQQ
ncbi:bcl-2/adenovirus E1B 19 kDa-interacting protein 2-like protein isoform X2 [Bombina bombina]|nr:bcl-2/adenovirus E1B 19 kDa-interacting protein 2-like protein isoform X2 [Bombina bombina]